MNTDNTKAKDLAALHEFDKVEWFDICKKIKPDLMWEDYEPIWDAFQTDKTARLKYLMES